MSDDPNKETPASSEPTTPAESKQTPPAAPRKPEPTASVTPPPPQKPAKPSFADKPAAPTKPSFANKPQAPQAATPQAPGKPSPQFNQPAENTNSASPKSVRPVVSSYEDDSGVSTPALIVDILAAAVAVAFTLLLLQETLPFLK